jgi:hypothetical protein
MSTDRDVNRIVRSWLEEGVTTLPDRVLDDVLDRVPATPQRRSSWPVRRFARMNNFARLAIAAAAVVVVAIVGYNMLPGSRGAGGLSPTPTPTPSPTPVATPSPTPVATPQVLADGPLEAGAVVARLGPGESMSATFTVPEGWEGFQGGCVLPVTGTVAPDGMGICFLEVAGLYSDPCHGSAGDGDIPVGPSAEDLANALAEQTAYEATAPTEVTLSGYAGMRVDLQLPSDVASCDNGEFFPWAGSIYAQGPDHRWHLWILDVEGERVIIVSTDFAGTSAQDQAEQQAIVDSIQIEP